MIDISDGISTDLAHICEESKVGAVLWPERIPTDQLEMALHGGEDYELLFTVPARKLEIIPSQIAGVPITAIGEIVSSRRPSIWLGQEGKRQRLEIRGWEHFRS